MPRRRYTVTVSAAEAARLRAFDNKAQGRKHWPLGPNRSFMRSGRDTFVVKEWMGMAADGAAVMTLGKATLREDDRVDVIVKTKQHWLGWLLIAAGIVCLAVTPREGFWSPVVGVALIAAGWFFFVRRYDAETDLDEVEKVLRQEISGEWRPAEQRRHVPVIGTKDPS